MNLTVALLIFAAAFAFIGYSRVKSRRQSNELASWAAARGWQYADHDSYFAHLSMGYPYGTGYNHSTHDVVTGTWKGHPAACLTYHYDMNRSAHAGEGLHSRYFSVWVLRLPKELPAMQVRRESHLSSILLPSGMKPVDVDDRQFSSTYKTSSDNPDFGKAVLDEQMMQFLLANNSPGFDITGADLVSCQDGFMTVATVDLRLDYLTAIIDRLPLG